MIHEVKPVISGRRLVLTYNLIQKNPGQLPSASNSSKELTKLRSIFSWWKENIVDDVDEMPDMMGYLLDHHYTQASLSLNSLKGKDLKVATYLNEASAEADVYFCLANVERIVMGACEGGGGRGHYGYYDDESEDSDDGGHHSIDDILEDNISLVYVAELDGSAVGSNMPFDADQLIQEDIFDDLEPDEEDFEGYTGNAGAQATHFYRRTIAILMPRSHRIPFFLQSSNFLVSNGRPEAIKWLGSLSEDLVNKPESVKQTIRDMKTICNLVLENMRSWKNVVLIRDTRPQPYSDEVLARVLQATINLQDNKLFAEGCIVCVDSLNLPAFEIVGSAIVESNLGELLPSVHSSVREPMIYDRIADSLYRIAHVISKQKSFTKRFLAILRICSSGSSVPHCSGSQKDALFQWRSQEWIKLLTDANVELSSEHDGQNICKILEEFGSSVVDQ